MCSESCVGQRGSAADGCALGFFSFSVVDIDRANPHHHCVLSPGANVACVVRRVPLSWAVGYTEGARWTCDLSLWFLYSLQAEGLSHPEAPLSKHYIIRNGLVNCVQLINMFYIFICLL